MGAALRPSAQKDGSQGISVASVEDVVLFVELGGTLALN
jgi:hypothetical protein